MFETCRVAQYPFTSDQPVQLADWELYVQVRAIYVYFLMYCSSSVAIQLCSDDHVMHRIMLAAQCVGVDEDSP